MVRASEVSSFISATDLKKGDVIEFLDDGRIVEDNFNKGRQKIEVKISLNGDRAKTFSPNAGSRNNLKRYWGDDMMGWVGKKAVVEFVHKDVGGELKKVAFLRPQDVAWDE